MVFKIKLQKESYVPWAQELSQEDVSVVKESERAVQLIAQNCFTMNGQYVGERLEKLRYLASVTYKAPFTKWLLNYLAARLEAAQAASVPSLVWSTLPQEAKVGYAQRELLRTYGGLPLASQKSIVLFSQIFPDGLGDWQHLKTVAEILARTKSFKLTVIALVPDRLKEAVQNIILAPQENLSVHKLEYHTGTFSGPQAPICWHEEISQELIVAIRTASVFMEVSSNSLSLEKFTKFLGTGTYVYLSEYGHSYNRTPDLAKNQFRMGFGPAGGIFFSPELEEPADKARCFEQLAKPVRDQIFGNDSHQSYSERHQLFTGYFNSRRTTDAFIYTIAKYCEEDPRDIDIVASYSREGSELDEEFLSDMGIAKMTVCNGTKQFDTEINPRAKKTLRIFPLFPMAQNDLFCLRVLSHPLGGSTGDCSFSEIASLNGLAFHEVRNYKQSHMQDLLELIRQVVPSSTLLREYYEKLQQTTLETTVNQDVSLVNKGQILGTLLRNPELWHANDLFLSFIKKEYRMNEMVVGIAKRAIRLAQNPQLVQIEHDLMHAAHNPTVLPEHVKEIVQRLKPGWLSNSKAV